MKTKMYVEKVNKKEVLLLLQSNIYLYMKLQSLLVVTVNENNNDNDDDFNVGSIFQ